VTLAGAVRQDYVTRRGAAGVSVRRATLPTAMAKRGRRATGQVVETSPGSWMIRWQENGRRRVAGRLPSRDVAERILAKVLGEVAQGLPGVPRFPEPELARPAPAPPPRATTPAELLEIAALLQEAHFGMERATGVYFLLRRGEIVYVGQSASVRTRLGQHMAAVEFDRALWIRFAPEQLDLAERCLIALLRPPLNKDTVRADSHGYASASTARARDPGFSAVRAVSIPVLCRRKPLRLRAIRRR
jgi:hypothetical protein